MLNRSLSIFYYIEIWKFIRKFSQKSSLLNRSHPVNDNNEKKNMYIQTESPPNERTCVLKAILKFYRKNWYNVPMCSKRNIFTHSQKLYEKWESELKNWVTALELENSQQFSLVIAFGGFGCKKRLAPTVLTYLKWYWIEFVYAIRWNIRMWLFNRYGVVQ